MRAASYKPRKLEVGFAKAFKNLTPQLEAILNEVERVISTKSIHDALQDKEGDLHEVVAQISQRPARVVE